jgi:IMP dehydrogenase
VKFLNSLPNYDLTYSDVFLSPSYSDVKSRFEVDLTTPDGIGTSIPLVVANMNAVAGKRMAETVARRGGIAVLPQDIPSADLEKIISEIKQASTVYETPVVLKAHHTINHAMDLIYKRVHGAAVVIDSETGQPVGIFTPSDAEGQDHFLKLDSVMSANPVTVQAGLKPEEYYKILHNARLKFAPVVDKSGQLLGAMSAKGALRSSLYKPNLDKSGKLAIAVAVGINGDIESKVESALKFGASLIVVDTAHGHQKTMIEALKRARAAAGKDVLIVAGNVVTPEAVRDLVGAGADIIKVGVGPGAMCTTRMMTGVGRPQFSAVLECAEAAHELGAKVWADGGVRHPRDVALALAAGADNVMFASWLAGTYEAAGDTRVDGEGRLYKENYGMASGRAVRGRTKLDNPIEIARKELFQEGISTSRMYINPERPGVEDIIDQIVAGVRSSFTYAGARNILEFREKAVVGLQSSAGYAEGMPVSSSW